MTNTIEGFKFPTCEVCSQECPNFRDKTGEQITRFCSKECRKNRFYKGRPKRNRASDTNRVQKEIKEHFEAIKDIYKQK